MKSGLAAAGEVVVVAVADEEDRSTGVRTADPALVTDVRTLHPRPRRHRPADVHAGSHLIRECRGIP